MPAFELLWQLLKLQRPDEVEEKEEEYGRLPKIGRRCRREIDLQVKYFFFNKEHKRTCHKKPLLQRIRCQHLVESSALLLFLSPPSSLPPSPLPVNYLAGSVSFNEKRSPPPSSLASVLPRWREEDYLHRLLVFQRTSAGRPALLHSPSP